MARLRQTLQQSAGGQQDKGSYQTRGSQKSGGSTVKSTKKGKRKRAY